MLESQTSHRPGFALPMALMALVLLSALVAGALFISTEELRAGRGDVADQRALAAAEWALDRAIADWDPLRNTRDTVGRTAIVAESSLTSPNDQVLVTGTRVQRGVVWLTSEATVSGDGRLVPAHHTIAASLRLVGENVAQRAALTARGAVIVDRAVVDGRAAAVSDASRVCVDDPSTDVSGISVPEPARVTCLGCVGAPDAGVFGNPAVDSSAVPVGDSSALRANELRRAALAARASIDLAGGTLSPGPLLANGACDQMAALNWGDPGATTPCADYYPIIHVRGDAILGAGSAGQGILVVDGSLRVEANARFVGAVIASGDITVSGVGAEIVGAAFADNTGSGAESRVSNGGAIRFAPCAVHRATLGSARLARTPVRWWIELR